jgi:DNA-binding transcriptional LysR family regulator
MLRPNGWIGVELRHFLALDAVASEASFNRAATKLGYTQSAISQQIATLERVVGQKLIERPGGSQPVRLTRAGEIVMEHAHAIGERLASAQADLNSLTAGELDPLPVHDTEFEHTTLLEDEYVLVVRAGSRAVAPTLDELAALPLIAFNTGKTCQLTDYFRANNLEPNWIVGSYDLETIYAFVAARMGSALLPRLATLCLGPDAEVIELACGLPPRRIGIAWAVSRGESGAAHAFVEAARAEAARFTPQRLSVAV